MVCQVEGCGRIRRDLTKHVKSAHNMTPDEYKQRFSMNLIDEDIIQQREEKNRQNSEGECYCPIHKQFVKNMKEFKKHCRRFGEDHNKLLYPDDQPDTWVQCEFPGCNIRMSRIDLHVESKHGMSKEEYEQKYGPTLSKNFTTKAVKNRNTRHKKIDE